MTSTYTMSATSQGVRAVDRGGRDLAELTALAGHVPNLRLRRRQVLPTATDDSFYIVTAGLIAAESAAVAEHRTIVELFYPGDIILPAPRPMKQSPTFLAMTPSEVWRFNPDSLKTPIAGNKTLGDYVLHRLNAQRARMQLHVTMLADLSSDARVAGLLLKAAYRLGRPNGAGVAFEMPLTRTEVAAYLALNADTLSRIMSRLVRDNVLARSGRVLMTVRDVEALKSHCPMSEAIEALYAAA